MSLETTIKITSIATPVISILALVYQICRARFAMSVELVLKLEDRFNSEKFEQMRSDAAKAALHEPPNIKYAEDVFDFFETIGLLLRKRAINNVISWNTFYEWVHGYWSVGKNHIEGKRQERGDKTLWEDFEYLHRELMKIQRRKANHSEPDALSSVQIREFLNDEIIDEEQNVHQ